MMSCKFQTPRRAKLENPQTETVKAQERTSIQPPVTEEAPLPSPEPHVCPVVSIPPTGIALEEIERQAVIEALKMSELGPEGRRRIALHQPASYELQDQDPRNSLPPLTSEAT
jgi:hypothetical protein